MKKSGTTVRYLIVAFLLVFSMDAYAFDFTDDFSTDSRSDYTVTLTNTSGGEGQFLYDSSGERLQVLTGDDVSLRFDRTLSASSDSGVFELDTLPTEEYPYGGQLTVWLIQDADNYYKIDNTDGYGAGTVSKVVGGLVVDSASLSSEYSQNTSYHYAVTFTPGAFLVDAFGDSITLSADSTQILVAEIQVRVAQQDAYFDNFSFNSEIPNIDPIAEAGGNQTVFEGDSVTLDGSGSMDADGTIASYLWEQTAGTAASFTPDIAQPSFTSPDVAGMETLTFQLTVTDDDGATDVDTVTVTVLAQGSSAFTDDFSTDSRSDYTVTLTNTSGGEGQFLYDSSGERLQVLNGDDVSLRFDRILPAYSDTGVVELDFLPTAEYPNGGQIIIQLMQDADNYYEIDNTDGYGPGTVSKVVGGQVVDSASFSSEYSQGTSYHIAITFTPEAFIVDAFGDLLTLSADSTQILVGELRVRVGQQDAYFDNFSFTSEIPNIDPVAEAGGNQTAFEGDSVTLDGTGSTDADGTIAGYLWEQTAGTAVSFTPDIAQPSFTAPDVAGMETLTFQLTVTDDDGATAVDTVTVTVLVQGTSAFTDDFSTDSRSDYTVTLTNTSGGEGQFLYDSSGERLEVLTGDNVSLRFDRILPASSDTGVVELDFLPTVEYPSGGEITIQLMQDADNYYEIVNTDGYGPGTVSKVVGGLVVDSASFSSEYSQGTSYHIAMTFTPDVFIVDAFGDLITLSADSTQILVGELRVNAAQQDAYFDNFSFNSEIPNIDPVAEAGDNQTVSEGDSVTLDGSGSTDADGTIAGYLWEQTSGTAVGFTPDIAQPVFTAPEIESTEVLGFQLTVTDDDGATAVDTVTVTVLAQGASAFADDFSTDSRSDYTVTLTWTQGGTGEFLFDTSGERLQVLTGNDVSLRFDRVLPAYSDSGVVELDFLPTTKYPNGGRITIQLTQDADNYYEIVNTDGYGAGTVSKVVGGQVVDSASFSSEYGQNTSYHITMTFTPEAFIVDAFGDLITLGADSTQLLVGELRVKVSQQDAYFDNFSFTSEVPNIAPMAEAGDNQTVHEGDSVTLNGSGSMDADGTIAGYLWEQTAGTTVSFTPDIAQPSFTAPDVASMETLAFQLTVTDDDGATAVDTATVTVLAQGASAFADDFSTDSRSDYTVTHTWTHGGTGEFLYDSSGERLQVLTGNDVALRFDRVIPAYSDTGVVELDFLPTVEHPSGGEITIQLMQDDDNYYEIVNTDGYGAGTVSKVVGGQVVDSASLSSEYSQSTSYHITMTFTPDVFIVDAFGDLLTLSADSTQILVGELRVKLAQQDAYFDNISFTSEVPNIEPISEAGDNQTVFEGDSVTLDGSGSMDADGTIASYLWEQTSGTAVSFTPDIAQPVFTAPDVSGMETLAFQLTVTDDDGATAVDTVTVTVLAQGASAFTDDFSTDSRTDYTVTLTNTSGGEGQFLYDSSGERLQVLTGDDVSLRFDRILPASSDSGVFELDTLPTEEYPYGGELTVWLMQDADNYYQITNTDGYGAGTVSKVVGGLVVDSASFSSEYSQNTSYHYTVTFTPGALIVEAFGDSIILNADSTQILVGEIQVRVAQQDAYFDNFSFTSEVPNLEPIAEAGDNQTVFEGDSVTLDGSGSMDADGAIVSYLWEQTSGTAVGFTPDIAQPAFTAPDIESSEVLGFQLTVTDDDGATATDTLTVTVLAQGSSAFTDDFSTDSRSDYAVTHTWTSGGEGQFLYDSSGERLEVLTGDDVSLRFDRILPAFSDSGVVELDFLPTVEYPNGGEITIQLMQDDDNYYEIVNTDGYGPGTVSKVVGGLVVDSASFSTEYSQNTSYHFIMTYSPETFIVDAFGDLITLSADTTQILVGELRVKVAQQDAYFDNFSLSDDTGATNFSPAARFQSHIEQYLTVAFDASESLDSDGEIVSYSWNFGDGNNAEGEMVSHSYAAEGTYLVTLTVTDDGGATDTMAMNVANNSDYYVAFGDSITRGSNDDITSDGIGFEPILADLLDGFTGYENTVVNEGVSGLTSEEGLDLLPSVLADHPDARYYLLMFGTNDAFLPVPSGLGLMPGDSEYTGSFKENMQTMINMIVNQGKIPYLAKIPFAYEGYEDLNPFIEEYNFVVEELVLDNDIAIEPANLYCLFENFPEALGDGLHPDGFGYQLMAQWWFDTLIGEIHPECLY